MLIDSGDIDINETNKIDIVVDTLSVQLLYIMNSGKSYESIQSIGYILYKTIEWIILKIWLSRILETLLIC